MAKYPSDLLSLIASLKKLPGVGSKTAERFAFHLLGWPGEQLTEFGKQVTHIKEKIKPCPECGCFIGEWGCDFCTINKRDRTMLCVLASAKDVYALEETRAYFGLYHVLGGLLSPLDGKGPEQLELGKLKERIESLAIKEVIIALDSTIEGDATALYLKEQLHSWGVAATRLAFGLPMGSSLDFVDGATLMLALTGRHSF
jgi:recombination protein RecR